MFLFSSDFAPAIVNLAVQSDPTTPSLTLLWDNPFEAIAPELVIVDYTINKLTGEPPNDTSVIITLERANITASGGFDSSYIIPDLIFYTEYSFELRAVYNVNQSDPVTGNSTTIQGGQFSTYPLHNTHVYMFIYSS